MQPQKMTKMLRQVLILNPHYEKTVKEETLTVMANVQNFAFTVRQERDTWSILWEHLEIKAFERTDKTPGNLAREA